MIPIPAGVACDGADYNQTARPFVWTKSEVHQKRLKQCFADQ